MKLTEDDLRSMIVDNLFTDEDIQQILENQKLRELIEKRIEHEKYDCSLYNDVVYPYCLDVLQELLEESKK